MKKIIVLSLFLYISLYSFSQNERKPPHPLVDSIKLRNELDINISPVYAFLISGQSYQPIFSLGYKRNFGRNHYLRAGFTIFTESYGSEVSPANFNESFFDLNTNAYVDTIVRTGQEGGNYNRSLVCPSLYLGHEHLFGRTRTRFVLGMDVFIGPSIYNTSRNVNFYDVVYIRDSINNSFSVDLTKTGTDNSKLSSVNFHIGGALRLGVRYEASPRVALSAVFAPRFYYHMGNFPVYSGKPQMYNLFVGALVSDLTVTIKM